MNWNPPTYAKCDRCGSLRPPAQLVVVVVTAQGSRTESRECAQREYCGNARKAAK